MASTATTMPNRSMNLGMTGYGQLSEISNSDYLKFKTNAIKFAPKLGKLDFKNFTFEKDGKISYKKSDSKIVPLNVTETALRRLCDELGLNKKFNPGQAVTKQLILNVLKEAKSSLSMNFSMNSSGEITNLTRKDSKMVDYATFFNLFERVMVSPDLEINQLIFNENTGELMMNVRSSYQMGFNDEVFNTGMSYGNGSKGFSVQTFVGRLVCTNGMIVGEKDSSFRTDSLNQTTIPRYQEYMKELKKNHYQPVQFMNKWNLANTTQASIAEVLQCANLIENKIPEGDLDLYLPGYNKMIEIVGHKLGDINTIPNESLMNLKSPIKMSTCLNGLTDVGSHIVGSGNHSRTLQIAAGKMLYKGFDVLNIMPQIF